MSLMCQKAVGDERLGLVRLYFLSFYYSTGSIYSLAGGLMASGYFFPPFLSSFLPGWPTSTETWISGSYPDSAFLALYE